MSYFQQSKLADFLLEIERGVKDAHSFDVLLFFKRCAPKWLFDKIYPGPVAQLEERSAPGLGHERLPDHSRSGPPDLWIANKHTSKH